MAEDYIAKAKMYASQAAPVGVSQVEANESGQVDYIKRAKEWYTGANRGSVDNGYNTAFLEKMFNDQQRASEEQRLATQFTEAAKWNTSGVVTYDHGGTRANGLREFRFGDVYDNGKMVGNIYDTYGDDTGDLMMLDFVTTSTQKAAAMRGGTQGVREEVRKNRIEATADAEKRAQALGFEADWKATAEDMREGPKDEVGAILAGAGGGAATFAAGGSLLFGVGAAPGAIVGTVVGGIGGYLNRDEIVNAIARADARTSLATEEYNTAAAWMSALQGVGEVGQLIIQPVTNVVKGIYDERYGTAGDGISEWSAVDPVTGERTRSNAWTGLALAGSLLDASGSVQGMGWKLFSGTMMTSIIGNTGQLVFTGGATFDDRRGGYDNIFSDDEGNVDLLAAAAGISSIGIDVLQLGLGRGMMQRIQGSNASAAAVLGAESLATKEGALIASRAGLSSTQRWLGEKVFKNTFTGKALARGETITHANGYKYSLDAMGRATGRKATMAILAPSEAMGALTTAQRAARMKARSGGALIADDFYQAAQRMVAGESGLALILVNGFGEGAEEGIQTFLEPVSHNAPNATLQEIFEASAQGFVMGAGMSMGSVRGGVSRDKQMQAQASYVRKMQLFDPKAAITDAEWKAMDPVQKQVASTLPEWMREVAKSQLDELARGQALTEFGGNPAALKLRQAQIAMRDIEAGKINSRTDTPLVITQHEDVFTESHAMVTTVITARINLQRIQKGLREQLEGLTDSAEDVALGKTLTEAIEQGNTINEFMATSEEKMELAVSAYEAQDPDGMRKIEEIVRDTNAFLKRAFDGGPNQVNLDNSALTPEQVYARQRAVSQLTVRFPLTSEGSYLVLMPQISTMLSQYRGNNGALVSHAVLQMIGGDFDGDKIVLQTKIRMDDEAFRFQRSGAAFLSVESEINVGVQEYTKYIIELVGQGMKARNKDLKDRANQTAERIHKRIDQRMLGIVSQAEMEAVRDEVLIPLLRKGDPTATKTYLNAIAFRFGNRVQAAGMQGLQNEWLHMDQIIGEELAFYQYQHALLGNTFKKDKLNTNLVPEVAQNSSYYTVSAERAATDGMTVGMFMQGDDLFREFQKLKYTKGESRAIDTGSMDPRNLIFAELQRKYKILSQNLTRSYLDEQGSRDEILGNALGMLTQLAGGKDGDLSNLAVLANTRLPNFTLAGEYMGDEPGQGKTLSVAQWVLREALIKDKADKYSVFDKLPTLQAKHARLNQMLKEDHVGAAFVELVRPLPMIKLVPATALTFGANRTVDHWLKLYVKQNADQRRETKERLITAMSGAYGTRRENSNAPYDVREVEAGDITPHRAMVDALLDAGNKRSSMSDDYVVSGDLAGVGKRTVAQLEEGVAATHKIFADAIGVRELNVKDIESVKQIMRERNSWAAKVFDLIPDAYTNGAIEVVTLEDGTQETLVSPWVYEMLLMPPAQAVMHYIKNLTILEWHTLASRAKNKDSERQYGELTNVLHRLMYQLQAGDSTHAMYNEFLNQLETATDVEEFFKMLNREYGQFNGQVYIPFVTDVGEYEVDKAGGGWSSEMDGSKIRKAIGEFKEASLNLSVQAAQENASFAADSETYASLERARVAIEAEGGLTTKIVDGRTITMVPPALNTDPAVVEYLNWHNSVNEALERTATLGLNVIQQEAATALVGFYAPATDKGKAPEHTKLLGYFQMLRSGLGFATPWGKRSNALTAGSVSDYGMNIQEVIRGGRTVDEDGTYIDWPPMTADSLLELGRLNPSTRGAIRALIWPSIYDVTSESESLSQQYIVGMQLSNLVGRDRSQDIFASGPRAKGQYVQEVGHVAEKYAPHTNVLARKLNQLAVVMANGAATGVGGANADALISDTTNDVGDFLQTAAELHASGVDLGVVREELKDALYEAHLSKLLKEEFGNSKKAAEVKELLQEHITTDFIRSEQARAYELMKKDPLSQEALDIFKSIRAGSETLRQRFLNEGEFDELLDKWLLPEADSPLLEARIQAIYTYVMDNPAIGSHVLAALAPVIKLTQTRVPQYGVKIPTLSYKEWDTLSRAIIAEQLDIKSFTANTGGSIPIFPEFDKAAAKREEALGREFSKYRGGYRAAYDQSFFFLVDDLLDPTQPLLRAAIELHVKAGRPTQRAEITVLQRKLLESFLDPKKTGVWTNEVPRQINSLNGLIDAGSVVQAVGAAGQATPEQSVLSQAMEYTYDIPPTTLVSTLTLTAAQLNSELDTMLAVDAVLPDGSGTLPMAIPLAELEGRFATGARLEFTDHNGVKVALNSWEDLPEDIKNPSGQTRPSRLGAVYLGNENVAGSDYRSLSVPHLRRIIKESVLNGIPLDSVTLTLDVLLPASKPSEGWHNNVLFEGVVHQQGASQQRSSNASLWMSVSGIIAAATTAALQSNKKHTDALPVAPVPTYEEVRALEAGWDQDFNGMLTRKALFELKNDPGSGRIPSIYYNALYKNQAMRSFVRGMSGDEAVLWDAERIIEWQRLNAGQPLPLADMELIVLPEEALMDLVGASWELSGSLAFDPSVTQPKVDKWAGTRNLDVAKRLPKLLARDAKTKTWVRKDILTTSLMSRPGFSLQRVRNGTSEKRLNALAAGMEYRRARATEIDAYRKAKPASMANAAEEWEAVRRATAESYEITKRVLGFKRMALGSWLMRNPSDATISELAQMHILEAMEQHPFKRGFLYQHYSAGNVASGVLTEYSLRDKAGKGTTLGDLVSYQDYVGVDLSSFSLHGANLEEQIKMAIAAVDRLMTYGATIALYNLDFSRGELATAVSRHIRESQYLSVAGSRALFMPPENDTRQQNLRARMSKAEETRPLQAKASFLTLLRFGDGMTTENAAYAVNPKAFREVAQTLDVVPTEPLRDFLLPVEIESVRKIKQELTNRNNEAGYKALVAGSGLKWPKSKAGNPRNSENDQQAHELIGAYKRMVDNWDTSVEHPMVTPGPNQPFNIGDLIPFYNEITGQILLYRHGYKIPNAQQLADTWAEQDGPIKVAVYRPDSEAVASVHTGRVVKFMYDYSYGLRVEMNVDLQSIFAKLISERNAWKAVVLGLPDSIDLPDFDPFKGWPISMILDYEAVVAKEALEMAVLNHRNAFAVFGVDFVPAVAKTLFGIKDYAKLPKESKTGQSQQKVHAMVVQALLAYSNGINLDPTETEALLSADSLASMDLSSIETTLNELAPNSLQKDWALDLNKSAINPEAEITRNILLYLTSSNARVEHVLRTGGLMNEDSATSGKTTAYMPSMFTEAFDRTTNAALRTYLNKGFNDVLNNEGGQKTGYHLRENWEFVVKNADTGKSFSSIMQIQEIHAASESPTMDAMADQRGSKSPYSASAAQVANMAFGGDYITSKAPEKTDRFISRKGMHKITDGASIRKVLTEIPAGVDPTLTPFAVEPRGNLLYRAEARERIRGAFHAIAINEWTADSAEAARNQRDSYVTLRDRVARHYGIAPADVGRIDRWVRQHLGRIPSETNEGKVSYADAMEALREIENNANKSRLPLYGAMIPALHVTDLEILHAAATKGLGSFKLASNPGSEKPNISLDWEVWVNTSIGMQQQAVDEYFDPAFRLEFDGFRHTYIDSIHSLSGMPISYDMLITNKLMDPENDGLILSIDPDQHRRLTEVVLLDSTRAVLEDLLNVVYVNGKLVPVVEPGHMHQARLDAMRTWRKKNEIRDPKKQNVTDYYENGILYVASSTYLNTAMRIAVNLRAGTALINPALWVSAIVETGIRGVIEDIAGILVGDTSGYLSTKVAKMMDKENAGIIQEEHESIIRMIKMLGADPGWTSAAYRETLFMQPRLHSGGIFERGSAWMAQAGTTMQDPIHRMRTDTIAKRYITTALAWIKQDAGETILTTRMLEANLKGDGLWLEKNYPRAHKAGMNSVANSRSLMATPLSLALKGIIDPLTQNPHSAISIGATLGLKLPTMFAGYGFNVFATLTGLQGVMQGLAVGLDGKKNPFGRWASIAARREYNEDVDGKFDMSDAYESLDLSKAFIRGGISHTSLFVAAMLAGGRGLSGEDEEDKRRRRAAAYQGAGYVYDPRKVENDFRSAEAVFLDNIPLLNGLFRNESEGRSMMSPNWIVRQFVSPLLGLNKFSETGDFRNVIWGFQDALNAFPLINVGMWDRTVNAADQLMAAAEDKTKTGDPKDIGDALYLGVSAFSALESMLFESSFVNTIYVGQDKYDRDPWVLPMTDPDGNVIRDRLNNPEKTDAMNTFVNADGEIQQGYVQRDWLDAQIHGLTENRATLALVMSLFTGQEDSLYFRQNMAIKTRKVEKQELTEEQAEGLILSLYDEATGTEVLSENGARAVFRGLWGRSVSLGDASLEGIYVTTEMRKAIQEKWMDELVQEGIDMGLDEVQAKKLMGETWYGSSTNPWATPLRDVVWSHDIGWGPTQHYNQLNTTYVMGPDGQPWATGFKRTSLLGAFGLGIGEMPYIGDIGNMDVDGRLNSVDEVNQTNTGLRALERVEESWHIPTDEEIGKSIEDALDKAFSKNYTPNSYTPWNYGGGGGGGGGSTRLYAPDASRIPYADTINTPYAANPYVRRASIRRERFSSTRGRLNQWQ